MVEGKSVHLGQISWSMGMCEYIDSIRGEGLNERERKAITKTTKVLKTESWLTI